MKQCSKCDGEGVLYVDCNRCPQDEDDTCFDCGGAGMYCVTCSRCDGDGEVD